MGIGEEAAQTLLQVTSKATLITADVILAAIRGLNKVLSNNNIKSNNENKTSEIKSGKQSIKSLSKQNVTLDSIPVTNIDIKQMTAKLKAYGVDFSVVKNKQTKDFNLFFKATDTAVISTAFEQLIKDNERSSEEKTSDKEEKKPLSEQKEEAQKKAEKQNAEKAAEKADKQQEKQKNKGREKDR